MQRIFTLCCELEKPQCEVLLHSYSHVKRMCIFDLVVSRGVFSKIVTTFSSRSFLFCDFSRLPLVLLLDGGRLLLPLQLPPPLLQQLVLFIPGCQRQYHLQLQVPQLSDSSRISI